MLRPYLFLFSFFVCAAAFAVEDKTEKNCRDHMSELTHSKLSKSIEKMLRQIGNPELYKSFDHYPEVLDSHAEALEEKKVYIAILLEVARKQPYIAAESIKGLVSILGKIEPELQETMLHQLESFYVSLYQQERSPESLKIIEDFDLSLSAVFKTKLELLEGRVKKEYLSISASGDLRKIRLSQLLDRFHASEPFVLSTIEVMAVVMATEKNSAKSFGPQLEVVIDGKTEYRAYQSFLRKAVSAENFSTEPELINLASLYASLLLSYYQIQNDVSKESQMNESFRLEASQWIEDYREFYTDLKEKERLRLAGLRSHVSALKDSPLMVERYLVDALSRGDEKSIFSIIEARDQKLQASLFRYMAEMARRKGRQDLAERFDLAGRDEKNTTSLFKALAMQIGFSDKFSKEKVIEAFLLLPEDERLHLIYKFSNRRFNPVDYIDFITELANHPGSQNYWVRSQVFNYLLEAAKPISPEESVSRTYYGKGTRRWKLHRTPELMTKALQNLRLFDEEFFAEMGDSLGEKVSSLIDHLKQSNDSNLEAGVFSNPFEATLSLLYLAEFKSSARYIRRYLKDRLRLFSVSWNLSLFEQDQRAVEEMTSHLLLIGGQDRSSPQKLFSKNAEAEFRVQVERFLKLSTWSKKFYSEAYIINQLLKQNLVPRISILFKLEAGIQKILAERLINEESRLVLYRLLEELEYAFKNSLLLAAKRYENPALGEHGAGRDVLRAGLLHPSTSVFSANLLLDFTSDEKPLKARIKAVEQLRTLREDFNEKLQSGKLLETLEFLKAKEILDGYYFAYFGLFKDFLTQKMIASKKSASGVAPASELNHILNLSTTTNPMADDLLSLDEAKKVFETLQMLNLQREGFELIQYENFKWPEKIDEVFEQELRAHFSALKRYIEYLYAYEDDGVIRWYAMEFRRLFDLN